MLFLDHNSYNKITIRSVQYNLWQPDKTSFWTKLQVLKDINDNLTTNGTGTCWICKTSCLAITVFSNTDLNRAWLFQNNGCPPRLIFKSCHLYYISILFCFMTYTRMLLCYLMKNLEKNRTISCRFMAKNLFIIWRPSGILNPEMFIFGQVTCLMLGWEYAAVY